MATVDFTEKELAVLERLLYVYDNDSRYWEMLKGTPNLDREPYDILNMWGKVYNILYKGE